MAFRGWEFGFGCAVFLICLLFVKCTSTIPDKSYHEYYSTLDSNHRSIAELHFDIDRDVKYSRDRRDVENKAEAPHLEIKSDVNNSSSIHLSTNVTSAAPSITDNRSLPSSDVTSANVHHTLNVSSSESPTNAGINVQRKIELSSPKDNTLQDKSTTDSSINNNSAHSANANPETSTLDSSQIIGAAFDSNAKNSFFGSLSDVMSDKNSEIAIKQFGDEIGLNTSLKEENITKDYKMFKDSHIYYNSTFITSEKVGRHFWVNLYDNNTNVKVHEMLSSSHRRAATVQLSFEFPFYGHLVTNVTVATGGFLFTGDHIHTWLAATQYIAPLMANFDTSIADDSFVKYQDNGTAFTVLWENVILKDNPQHGRYTFEATLHKNGDIVFVYKSIPVVIEDIKDDQHPVKVGLSDAYIIDRVIFFVKRKTIYEYHRVNFDKEDIKNWTVIYLHALPTCHDMKDCDSCISSKVNLDCKWCPTVGRCSTGLDRARQEWLINGCDRINLLHCNESPPPPFAHKADEPPVVNAKQNGIPKEKSRKVLSSSGLISVLVIMTSMATVVFLIYAYRNPHSTPGQILIRYRPAQWRWRRGEARYTAATIHM
ncbi:plexin domain containing lethal (1) G0289 [Lycorma delicatula]|uniref:plexin domain containing lethal (1) G0289 n=1 Tax=Lycorma delicatula TaxID=130591 RepID=UPI003F514B51